jgi:hypothetical protein
MVHRVVALAGVILIAALAFCLLDAGHAAEADLCGALGPSVGLTLLLLVTLTGRVLPPAADAYALSPLDRPVPPPRA